MSKLKFDILSLTWGLPLTLIGAVVATILMVCGYRPKVWGYCCYFEVGDNWGGLNLGMVFLISKNTNDFTKTHEFGHAIQNCYYGPFMLFIVSIPSAIRYWYRSYLINVLKISESKLPDYYSIWFERQANEFGNTLIKRLGE